MNLKLDGGDVSGSTDLAGNTEVESVTSEDRNIPLPQNIDDSIGSFMSVGDVTDFQELSSDNFEALDYQPPENIDSLFGPADDDAPPFLLDNLEIATHDSYYEPTEAESEQPISSEDIQQFSSLIQDKCLGVPPTLSVKLPWEDGIMSHIFDESDGLPSIPLPQMSPVEVREEAPKSPPCLNPFKQGSGRGVYMGVINFDLNLTESEMEQNTWSSALQKWYTVFSSGRQAWPKGYDLDKAIDSHDIQSLREVFGSRSANTVLRRGNTMVRFMKWYRDTRFSLCPFPILDADVEDYLGHLSKNKAGASAFSGFLEAIRFCEHVVGIAGASTCISIKAQKMVELADLERPEKHQARVLTVNEVETLERILLDEKAAIADRYAAGALLFCLYSRSRLSDLKKVRGYVKDIIEVNGTISGYIEFRTRSHKTARLVSRQGIAMPLVAPVWGLLSPPWGLNFIRVAELAGIQLCALHDDALLPAPVGSLDAGWQPRSVTTNEAGKWLRSLLSGRLGEIEYTTVHCLKGTPLSWCAKAGLDETTRLLLGHHVSGKHSADVYARDALAAPLREFDGVLQNIRSGNFMPDATRSGMIGAATRQDPKDTFTASIEEEKPADSSSSSSDSDSSSDESHQDLILPDDPVAEKAQWEPDYEMYQHDKSQIVHLRAGGSQQNSFSCGVRMTAGFKRVNLQEM
eukprot:s203_g46.t1